MLGGEAQIGTLRVLLSAETAQYLAEMERAKGAGKGVGEDVKTQVSGMNQAWGLLKAGGAIAVGVLGAVAGATSYMLGEASAAQDVQAQLGAVLASTGGVAGVSANMANAYATELQGVTRYSDETILSGENLMLTFTKVGSEVFPDAMTAALDLSAALKKDLESSVLMVGKALNVQAGDVVAASTAMNAMKRVGVAFTTDQIEMAKQLVATGDMMAYQKLVLGELNTEFGGSAAAAGKTFAGAMDIAQNKLSDVAETWGGELLPIAQDFVEGVTPILIDSLDVLTQTQLPRFVELIGKTADGLLTAFDAGMLLVTWSDRIELSYGQQIDLLAKSNLSYEEYVAGVLDAAVAAGTLHSQWVEMHGAAVAQGEVTDQMRTTLGLLTEEERIQTQQVASLDAAYAAAGVTAYTWIEATEDAETATGALTTQSSLLKDAMVGLVSEGFDPAKTAAGLLKDGIDAITDSAVEAERITLLFAIAQKTAALASGDLTAAERAQASAELELMLNQQTELENMDKLNQLYDAGTITKYDWIAAMADEVVTTEELNTLMGVENTTIATTEEAMFLAEQATRKHTDAQQGLIDKAPETISSLDFLASAALNAAGDYEINFKVNVYGDPIPGTSDGGVEGKGDPNPYGLRADGGADGGKGGGGFGGFPRPDGGAEGPGGLPEPSGGGQSYEEMLQAVMGSFGFDEKRARAALAEMGIFPGEGATRTARNGRMGRGGKGKGVPETGGMPGGMPRPYGGASLAGGGAPPIVIQQLIVQANDPDSLVEQLYVYAAQR